MKECIHNLESRAMIIKAAKDKIFDDIMKGFKWEMAQLEIVKDGGKYIWDNVLGKYPKLDLRFLLAMLDRKEKALSLLTKLLKVIKPCFQEMSIRLIKLSKLWI